MGADSVIRGNKEGFTVIYDSVIRDVREGGLSLKTLGLFTVMSSFPDSWEYSVAGLAARCHVGRDTIRKCLRELEAEGYLLREQSHDDRGRFSGAVFVLQFHKPHAKLPLTEKPSTVKPTSVLPMTENRPQVNTQVSKHTSSNPPLPPADVLKRMKDYSAGDIELYEAILGLAMNRHEALGAKKAVKTVRTINGILNDLDKFSGGHREVKLLMLEKAVKNNWMTVYELKPDELPKDSRPSFNEEGEDGI